MINILQIAVFIMAFAVIPITAADYYWGNGFLDKFLIEQSLPIMGTILAISILRLQHPSFLLSSIMFVIAIFVIHLFVMVATPAAKPETMWIILFLKGAKVFTFVLYIFVLCKLSHLLFGVRTVINSFQNNS